MFPEWPKDWNVHFKLHATGQTTDVYKRQDMFSALIRGWREEWQQWEFPFYYCQIAPYDYGIITEPGKNVINSAYLREQQALSLIHI